jgi:hypothetical protein
MADGYRTRRVAVPPEPLVGAHDYADAFALLLDRPDAHTAEEWVRQGLEGSPAPVRWLIRFVHAHVIRFELDDGPDAVLGWRIVRSEPEVIHLQAQGPMARADIVARRTSPTSAGFSTFLSHRHSSAPALWRVIGPLHRAIAPYLLRRAASSRGRSHDAAA